MILLDEQLTGLAPFLRSLSWEVETVNEIGLLGASDQKILEYITLNSLILVTEDTQLAQLAELNNQEHVWINPRTARYKGQRIISPTGQHRRSNSRLVPNEKSGFNYRRRNLQHLPYRSQTHRRF